MKRKPLIINITSVLREIRKTCSLSNGYFEQLFEQRRISNITFKPYFPFFAYN